MEQEEKPKPVKGGTVPSTPTGDKTVPQSDPSSTNTRVLDRKRVYVDLPVYDANRHHRKGFVIDITSRGIGLRKIHTTGGDVIHWVVCADEHFPVERFSFVAKCQWTAVDHFNNDPLSGFQIVRISPEDSAKLRKFLLFLGSRYFRDLTAHLRSEETLRSVEAEYRSIVENHNDLVVRILPDASLSFVNQAFCNLVRKNRDILIGQNFFDWASSQPEFDPKTILSLLTPECPYTRSEFGLATPSGEIRLFDWHQKVFFDEKGSPAFYQLVGRDITEMSSFILSQTRRSKELEEDNLRLNIQLELMKAGKNAGQQVAAVHVDPSYVASVSTLKALESDSQPETIYSDDNARNVKLAVDKANFGIAIANLRGEVVYSNNYFARVHGLSTEEVVGQRLNVFHTPEQMLEVNRLNTLLAERGSFNAQEVWHLHESGREFPMIMSGVLIRNEKGEPELAVSAVDITELKQIQEALSHSQKMEAVGTLAGGIAHDVNNALFVMTGYADLALGETEPGSRTANYLNNVLKAGQRIKEMVNQILAFGQGDTQEKKPLRLTPFLKETLKYMRGAMPGNVQMEEHIDCSKDMIQADATQMYQLIVNLLVNARDAMMDHGGALYVGLDNIVIDCNAIDSKIKLSVGEYVRLTVKDTGSGMTKEIKDRIFDPFFTTKQAGRGMGMGLPMIHVILDNHNAAIEVDSEVGKGSTFYVYFNVFEEKSEQTEITEKCDEVQGSERILFVDDDESILEMSKQLLELMGYAVSTATSGPEAMKIMGDTEKKFDLVITDMTMPIMNGIQLAQQIKLNNPDLPVILCSGYTDVVEESKASEMGINAYITKPIGKNQLAETIRRLLD